MNGICMKNRIIASSVIGFLSLGLMLASAGLLWLALGLLLGEPSDPNQVSSITTQALWKYVIPPAAGIIVFGVMLAICIVKLVRLIREAKKSKDIANA